MRLLAMRPNNSRRGIVLQACSGLLGGLSGLLLAGFVGFGAQEGLFGPPMDLKWLTPMVGWVLMLICLGYERTALGRDVIR